MRKYTKKIYVLFILFTAVGYGCSENDSIDKGPDIEKPTIVMVDTSPQAKEGLVCNSTEQNIIYVSTGNSVVLNLRFTDNLNLSQYKIDVHNNFDCHSHSRILGSSWQLLKIENINSNDLSIKEELQVPEDALAGDYHLQILCLDEAGNEADPLIYSIKVENAIDNVPPQISLSEPSSGTVNITRGEELSFSGSITDNNSLSNGKIEITYKDPKGTEFFPIQEFFPEEQGTEASFDLKLKIPPSATTGKHIFSVIGYDTFNNSSAKVIEVVFE
ncbi:hypothetical protein GCM10011506_45280 [Marivirga lumbricoides]|uniref:DUF4625 domain-containing protein n=1 Tax=Marivirga lumbricoides TaxID=1046115 RepID=A0ABQ1N681_9BACT|nr:hypothetical protein GCM10011506_45280 [Marivirga lumbricoides]